MRFLMVGTDRENTGAATHFVALALALADAGHEVHLVACPGSLIEQELTGSRVQLHQGSFRNAADVRAYASVLAAARQSRPEWLVGNFGKEYWPLILIGRRLGVPVALFRHRAPPMKALSAWLVPRLAQRFFAVSNYARQAYLVRGTPPECVRVLYNPVNLQQCHPDAEQRRTILLALGIDEGAIVLGYVGRLHSGKGIFTLLEAATAAMTQEPRLHCLWLGDGPAMQTLRERVAASGHGPRHHFLGWVNDVHAYYSAMSMLAFPSIAPETFGRVSVEAQASGVPVLGSHVGGIPETMDPGVTGVLLPPGDVAVWRQAITAMCQPQPRLAMGKAARQFVQTHFSFEVISDRFVQILREGSTAR